MNSNLGQVILVKDINPKSSKGYSTYADGSFPDNLTEFNDRLYFTANDGRNGNELWVTNGTTAGTHLVADIRPGTDRYGYAYGSYAGSFAESGGKLYFTANDGETGNELWLTDGTTAGTHLVADIRPGTSNYGYIYGSNPYELTESNGKLYFNANDGETGNELWVSDGTTAGTKLLLDINPGTSSSYLSYSQSSYASNLTKFNDKLYFTANDGENGNELWVTDGTTAGTKLLADINPGVSSGYYTDSPRSSYAGNFTEFDDKLYFTANDGKNGNELWVSDGTTAGTKLLLNINLGTDNYGYANGSYANNLKEFNDKLYFTAIDGQNGNELWVTDGTTAGTKLLLDINPGVSSDNYTYLSNLTEFDDKLYFTANDGQNGNELWISDGTTAGTKLLADINPGVSSGYYTDSPRSSYAGNFTEFNDKLYFTANDGETGNELWTTDGTTAGTQLVADINPGANNYGYANSSYPEALTVVGDELLFRANNQQIGTELYKLTVDNVINITGTDGDDHLVGTKNPEQIIGLGGDDRLYGLVGEDTLIGGTGKDTLIGGSQEDVFAIASEAGTDKILDFELGSDRLGLTEGLKFERLSFNGEAILAGDEILATLVGVNTAHLTDSDFLTI